MRIGTTSRGIYSIPYLKYFFSSEAKITLLNFFKKREVDAVIGWGNKPSSVKAKKYANKYDIPYISLEDGFIRSLAPAKISPLPLSIVFDDLGIYYDASKPSRLEELIIHGKISQHDLERAKKLITEIKENQISKYNHASEDPKTPDNLTDYVLVIDQTYNDLSVSGSLADSSSFKHMLEAALDENPESTILVKTHPEVIAGYKKGYLIEFANKYKCKVVSDDINPWSLIKYAKKVYTVSSQMGFEALMAEKIVRCFGLPFYAGWGLTSDELRLERRNISRNLYEIFIAVYLKYPVYLNPFTLEKCEIEEILPIISLWKDINQQNKNIQGCAYISKWKRKSIAKFLKSTSKNPVFYSTIRKALNSEQNKGIAAWASKLDMKEVLKFKRQKINLTLMEDGFLRSVGLGANLITPQSVVIDGRGIYYNHSQPSDLEHIIQNTNFPDKLLIRARNIINQLNELEITKYNTDLQNMEIPLLPEVRLKILVVGQVENDASIKLGTVDIKTNLALLKKVREQNPKAFIIYKPHPDCVAGQRPGIISKKVTLRYANLVIEHISIVRLIEKCDEVHTLTSLTGFEALIRSKKVTCYGIPFYAGWGLTKDLYSCPKRTRKISLEELVAASLIIYPRYLDPKTNLWCSPEVIISRLSDMREVKRSDPMLIELRKLLGKIKRILENYIL